MASKQHERNSELIKWDGRIKKNRDFCGGEWDIKQAGDLYMPRPDPRMSNPDYDSFLKRINVFTAASRAHDGYVSLILREDPVLDSEVLQPIKNRITMRGDSIETFSEEIISESLMTDYVGILVDHPTDAEKPEGVNPENASALGWHPMLNCYPFESILDLQRVRIGDGFQYVKLADSEDQYRELILENKIYTVKIHKRDEHGAFHHIETIVPRRDRKPLDFIPFEIIKRHNGLWPRKALLEDVVNLNCGHYIQEGDLSLALFHCSGPQKVAINPPQNKDDDGNEIPNKYPAGSHVVIELWGDKERAPDFKFNEFTGAGVLSIREQQKEIRSQISATSLRLLSDEKAVAESAEALEIRRTSENATLAGVTRSIMLKMEKVLRWQAWWMGAERKDDPNTRFTLNLDFAPSKMTPAELQAYGAAVGMGLMTKRDVFYLMRQGGLIPDTKTWEQHQAELEAQAIDDPLAGPLLGGI